MSLTGNNPRRIANTTCLDSVVFNDATTTTTSTAVNCSAFHDFLLSLNVDVTGAPTDILFDVEFSQDNSTFYKYMTGPFGDLRYEDTAGDKLECISGRCLDKYIRLKATATGTAEAATFTVSAYLTLSK